MYVVRSLVRAQAGTMITSAVLLAACAGAVAGCFSDRLPTRVMVTPVSTEMRPAKPPDCDMPVLTEEPTVPYQQIAIVEAWADIHDDQATVLPKLKREACASGAQALLIVSGKKQDVKSLLYGVTPNQTETQVTATNNSSNQAGEYISMMEHTRRIGEPGHNGYYVDAIAIDYGSGAKTAVAAGQPTKP